MKELIVALMVWASAHTGLPMTDQLPRVETMDRCQMFWIKWPGEPCPEDKFGEQRIAALYNGRTVYLRDDWHANDLFNVSVLLHELVHHLQYENGIDGTPCRPEMIEKPAYEAQIDFLKAAGVEDPLTMMGMNDMAFLFATKCMPYNF